MREAHAFRPACAGLEGRVVLNGSGASAAAVVSAGDVAGNQAALSAFARQVQQGLSPTLTVDFGTPAAAGQAGTVVLPDAAYSPDLGYGWLSNPGRIKIRDGVATGGGGHFEVDVPPGTYDVTVTPSVSRDLSVSSQVTAFAAGDTIGGPGASFMDPGPAHPVTLRVTVLQSGAGNGLTVGMDGGFAVRSVQITAVPGSGAVGLFTPAQPAPTPRAGLVVSGSGGPLSIGGTAQAAVMIPESGDVTFGQTGAAEWQSLNDSHNWALDFTKAAQGGLPNAPSGLPVGGILSAISNVSIRNTGGTLDIETPRGRVDLVVHGPADTALPFDDLASSIALTYKVHGGTGVYRDATGSGTVDVELTPTGQSVAGTVTQGVLTPLDAEETLAFTFNPGK